MADANTDSTTTPASPDAANPDAGQGKPDAPVDWETKFTGQQKVNRDLEQKLNDLRDQQKAQNEALAKAFGLAPDETSDVTRLTGQVTELQQQFSATQHQNLVLSVANGHKISDPDDLALLAEVKDETKMRALAARLAEGDAGTSTGAPGTPKPDRTQGAGAGAPASPAEQFASFITGQLGS